QLIKYVFPLPNVPLASCSLPDLVLANGCPVSASSSSQKPTWLIDVDYKPTNDILLYAKWSRGYRAGGVNLQAPSVIRSFGPEKVDTYEGGIKTTFRGAVSGTFNVSAFYNDFTAQQLPVSLNSASINATATTNAGKSRIYGLEAELTVTPFNGLTIDAAYTYLNTKLQSATAPVGDFRPFIVTPPSNQVGQPLLLSPKNQFTVTGTYTLPLPESVGRLSLAATFTHTDKQLSNYVDETFPTVPAIYAFRYLEARNLLNLNLNWNRVANSPIDLSLFATNVTNQKYYAFISGLASVGFEGGNPGEPRMYGVRVRYSFGS
ncbi:MAG TPA: TonB-dependent receptor, partial [Novosphingobium sp.]